MTADVSLQPAYILQRRQFRETSLILDAFTRDYGRIPVLAKGVRKAKSKTAGLLQPFVPLVLSCTGKSELKTLTDVEIIPPSLALSGMALYCGFYVNELVAHFLHKHDAHPEVFSLYGECLASLSGGSNIEASLRLFELDLITAVGYGLDMVHDAHSNPVESFKSYVFHGELGLIESQNGYVSGNALLALKARELTDPTVLTETKMLMRNIISVYLQGKPLKSRAVINQILKHV